MGFVPPTPTTPRYLRGGLLSSNTKGTKSPDPSLDAGGAAELGPGRGTGFSHYWRPGRASQPCSLHLISQTLVIEVWEGSQDLSWILASTSNTFILLVSNKLSGPTGTPSVEDRHWAPVGTSGTSSAPDLWWWAFWAPQRSSASSQYRPPTHWGIPWPPPCWRGYPSWR